jgi:hypothetical protein
MAEITGDGRSQQKDQTRDRLAETSNPRRARSMERLKNPPGLILAI